MVGATASRDFGPFAVSWTPTSGEGAAPTVLLRIDVVGALLWTVALTVTSADSDIGAHLNAYTISGTIGVSWLDPRGASGLIFGENVVFVAPEQRITFSGMLGVW